MGYCVSLEQSTIVIKKENSQKVVEALKRLANEKLKTNKQLIWVNLTTLVESESIEESFDEIRYQLKINNNGDYEIDYMSGEKLGNDFEIFQVIAPYVENGFIEMSGEDNNMWRWVFKNGKCKEIYPDIRWNED